MGNPQYYKKEEIDSMFATMQTGSVIVDAIPTNGSSNPVSSNGVFDALALKFPKYPINFDKIAVSGTSITFGVGAGPGTKWIDVFKATIDTVLGRTITVINGGISGQSSGGMLTNLPSLIAQLPQIILLEISINDANINGLSYTQSESNYRDMISLCNNANIVPVIFNCWPINVDNITAAGQGTFVESKRTNLCNLSRKLSIELNVQLIDLDLVCAQNVALMFEGLHPTVRGHLFGANVISGEIIKQATTINQLPI